LWSVIETPHGASVNDTLVSSGDRGGIIMMATAYFWPEFGGEVLDINMMALKGLWAEGFGMVL
jgi:hypothetical protein